MIELSIHQPLPVAFKAHTFSKKYEIDYPESEVWSWLNDPKTFTDHQVWPYRVEFIKGEHNKTDFETGVFNTHHGPLMSFSGVLGDISDNYRDLKYLYGSYFLSIRWIRPHRLQFWTESEGDKTILTMQLDSYVKPSFYGFWTWGQNLFWSRFGKWANKSIKKMIKIRA